MKKLILVFSLLSFSLLSLGQESNNWDYELRGYLKYFSSYGQVNERFFSPQVRPILSLNSFDQQLHNRFDLRVYRGAWSAGLSMRNRLFNGSQLENGAFFFDQLDNDPGLVDLSLLYWRDETAVLHTIFDRLWLQYESDKILLRLGRQRINWGINTIWNPNDILNQYNFFDFDYEERPGNDALRLQYFSSFTSSWELALAPAEKLLESTAALLYKNNYYRYDFQLIGAFYRNNLSLGGGWAGNIWNFGFKGEANYYWGLGPDSLNPSSTIAPREIDSYNSLVFSSSIDYVFSNGLYLSASYLYNQEPGPTASTNSFNSFSPGVVLSPKNPFPFGHTIALNSNYAFNPINNGSFTIMYDPQGQNLIFFPSYTYSLSTNLDLLAAAQFFLTENRLANNDFQWLSYNLFLRLKWSF